MRLNSFLIKNFKSIEDSDWINLSTDNINCIIGQNESGKSSILEALYTFYSRELLEDSIKSETQLPSIICSFGVSKEDFELMEEDKDTYSPEFLKLLVKNDLRINMGIEWNGLGEKDYRFFFEENVFDKYFSEIEKHEETLPDEQKVGISPRIKMLDDIERFFPSFSIFVEEENLLPKSIEIEDLQSKTSVKGKQAVQTLLRLTDINVARLVDDSRPRMKDDLLQKACEKITKDFQRFWSQYLGTKDSKIGLEFVLKHHSNSDPNMAGKPYLTFYIKDKGNKLHPDQRSRGVRWYLSFFLFLKDNDNYIGDKVLLVDEPGNSLHSNAKIDILNLIESLDDVNQIIYTTHYPELIQVEKLYRVIAAERSIEEGEFTVLRTGEDLYKSSTETLSPIYNCIGMNLSLQTSIPKDQNIILEEPSAFYYFKAMSKLIQKGENLHFIPGSGVAKLPLMCNLFYGWGLGFVAVMDGDTAGIKKFREIKKSLFGDEKEIYENKLELLNVKGVEDLFTKGEA